jgi:hypothetical protein
MHGGPKSNKEQIKEEQKQNNKEQINANFESMKQKHELNGN